MKKTHGHIHSDPENELRKNGLRVTAQRKAVLALFSEACNPMNAEMIQKRLKKMDLVTIYRTLASLEKASMVQKVDLHKDSIYYELRSHHHHIICTRCKTIEEVDQCDADNLVKNAISHSSKFNVIERHSLEFFGICKACMKG